MRTLPALAAALFLLALKSVPAQSAAPAADYSQAYRPQVHFSPQQHWMNDPNGLVHFEGEYHLFFQFNPFGDTPGHISWGHAVSTDLLHWQQLPVAIPAIGDDLVFTGSVVVDEHNSSGLCQNGKPCMVAVFTSNKGSGPNQRETQALAVSQDRGRTWQRYSGNPVLDLHMTDFRDPDAQWNEQTKSWLMAVALPNDHVVAFYSSADLKQWTRVSTFGPAGTTAGQWECPNLVKVPSSKPGQPPLWALKIGINPGALQGGSGEQYFLGHFDGKTFTPTTDTGAHGWSDYGKDSYCAISYNHLPATDKPTLIGWMDNWQYADKLPTSPWRGQMTLPRHLTYTRDADGLALVEAPLTEPLRNPAAGHPVHLSSSDKDNHATLSSAPFELQLHLQPSKSHHLTLRLASEDNTHYTELGFDLDKQVFFIDRTHSDDIDLPNYKTRTEAPLAPHRPLTLRLIVDRNSLEVFAQDGTIAMTDLIFINDAPLHLELLPDSGSVRADGQMWTLQSVWSNAQTQP